MVNFPKMMNTYCAHCNAHHEHKVSVLKTGARNPIRQGNRKYDAKQEGFGGQKKPVFRKKCKTTKVVSIKLQCPDCKKIHQREIARCKTFSLNAATKK